MTDEHVFDELPLLLSGEADRDTVTSAATHLRSCEDCRQELISAVAAHAALTSAVRFAPELADSFPLAGVDAVSADAVSADAVSTGTVSSADLPDLSAMFAQVRSEAGPASLAERRGSRRGRGHWLVAAALVAAAGAGGGIAVAVTSHDSPAPSRSVALAAYDHGTTPASVKLIGGKEMKLDAAALPALSAGEYYEVWLTDSARKNMAAVGQLDQDRKGVFTVPAQVMNTYSAIEVSVQQTTGTGGYSGVSVLRGSYA
jgi:hypothetical protein